MPRSTAIPARLRLLQALDRAAGDALCRVVPPRARALATPGRGAGPLPAGAVRAVLVVRPGGLGDAVLTWPLLHALAAAWPDARVDVLAERRNAGAFRTGGHGPRVFLYDEAPLATWRRLREARHDLVIDTEQYHRLSILVANALAPRWLCGFDTAGHGRFLTHAVPHSEDDYEAESFLHLAAAVTGKAADFVAGGAFVPVAPAELAGARAMLAAAQGRRLVALMPGAGGEYRLWPAERYAEVARALVARGDHVVLLGGADASAAAAHVAAACGPARATDLTARTSLPRTAAVLQLCGLALCADTGVLHLAAGVGTPTVALFGPGRHRKWAPRGPRHRIVRLGLPCSPCTRDGRVPPCPIGVACMRDLPAQAALAAVESLEAEVA